MKWILVTITLGVILFLGGSFLIKPESGEFEPPQTIEENSQQGKEDKSSSSFRETKEEQIRIILTGDIMLNRGVKYMVEKYGKRNFDFPFLKIANYLKGSDILFGNLEGVISDKGTKAGSIYSFRAEPAAIDSLTYTGFNVLSLANNHAFDYGIEALTDCLTRLKNKGINYIGAGFTKSEAYSPIVKEIKGTKIGFLAYTNLGPETWRAEGENPGIAWISKDDFQKVGEDIKKAKEKVDILIISLHSGKEYQKMPTQFQIDFAKTAIDAGADLVVGHHPHVTQSNKKYKNGYIFYSLGNFVFDQSFSEETMQGQVVEVIIKDKKIKEINQKEIKINAFYQPELK